jgi:hypothetical protein
VSVESGYPIKLLDGLRSRKHNLTLFDVNIGVAEVQAVQRLGDWFYGSSVFLKSHLQSMFAHALVLYCRPKPRVTLARMGWQLHIERDLSGAFRGRRFQGRQRGTCGPANRLVPRGTIAGSL